MKNQQTRAVTALALALFVLLTACGSSSEVVGTTSNEAEPADDGVAVDDPGIDDLATGSEPADETADETTYDSGEFLAIDMDALTGNTWTLLFGGGPDGEVVGVEGYPLTITFDGDGSFGGTAACNGYGGVYELDASEIYFQEVSWNEMGCQADVQAAEGAFLAALLDVSDINLVGEELALSGPASELIFRPVELVSLEPLWGRSFTLEATLLDGIETDAQGEEVILAIHPDDTFTATTGCRTLEGALVAFGNEFITTEMAATGECPASLAKQDGHIIEVLGDGFSFELDDAQLLISSAGNIGLHYRDNTLDAVVDAPEPVSGDS